MAKKLLDAVVDAGKSALKAVGVDLDLAAKREVWKQCLADRENRIAEQKRLGAEVERLRLQEVTGETWAGHSRFMADKFRGAVAAVQNCEVAKKQLMDTAPHEVRMAFQSAKKDFTEATSRQGQLERELADERQREGTLRADLKIVQGLATPIYPTDATSTANSKRDHEREIALAEKRLAEQEYVTKQVELQLDAHKKNIPAVEESLAYRRNLCLTA